MESNNPNNGQVENDLQNIDLEKIKRDLKSLSDQLRENTILTESFKKNILTDIDNLLNKMLDIGKIVERYNEIKSLIVKPVVRVIEENANKSDKRALRYAIIGLTGTFIGTLLGALISPYISSISNTTHISSSKQALVLNEPIRSTLHELSNIFSQDSTVLFKTESLKSLKEIESSIINFYQDPSIILKAKGELINFLNVNADKPVADKELEAQIVYIGLLCGLALENTAEIETLLNYAAKNQLLNMTEYGHKINSYNSLRGALQGKLFYVIDSRGSQDNIAAKKICTLGGYGIARGKWNKKFTSPCLYYRSENLNPFKNILQRHLELHSLSFFQYNSSTGTSIKRMFNNENQLEFLLIL
ncbi:MAG: hypothetical protein GYA36_22625 [Veillonellaceae bacterium]|nr:hypothetical protein [Veillonellaceae bacterium]